MPHFRYEVVIPAWNAQEYLGETLASLATQTVPPARVTVVDDGSTDNTVQIAKEWGANVIASPHVGVVGVRNQGLAQVEAPFVAFVDSDDLWQPDFAARQAESWPAAGPDFAAIGTLVEPFGESDLTAWRGAAPVGGLRCLTTQEVWERNPLTASAIIFRTEALRRINGWREGYTPTDDYDTSLRLVGAGYRLGLLQEVLGRYRVRNGSWSSRAEASLISEEKALLDFWSSEFRRGNEPGLSLEDRMRTLWWRTLARAAQYGQDLRLVPAPLPSARPSSAMRMTYALLRLPGVGSLTASAWRWLRRRFPRPDASGTTARTA